MGNWLSVVKSSCHVLALLFTGWWLLATSSPGPGLEPDCFTGLADDAKLTFTLVQDAQPSASAPQLPSCAGLDGLAADVVVTVDLFREPRRNANACYGYAVSAVSGVSDISLREPGTTTYGYYNLFVATGDFASSTKVACRGFWRLELSPKTPPARGELISPLSASASEPWVLTRSLSVAQAQFCDGVFAEGGAASCSDQFLVESISEVAP